MFISECKVIVEDIPRMRKDQERLASQCLGGLFGEICLRPRSMAEA